MLTNKPEPIVFERQCIRFFIQALDMIIKSPFSEPEAKKFYEEADCKEIEYWKYHQGILQNSIVLLFLAIENYLKLKICEVTPLLLIDDSPRNWRTLTCDKPFEKMYIKQFDDLLVLFVELGFGRVNDQTINKLIELKEKRNKIVHGILQDDIVPKYIFEIAFDFIYFLWADNTWWQKLIKHLFEEPLFGLVDSDFESASVVKYIDNFVKYLGLQKTGKILNVNFEQRLYYCPTCHYALNHNFSYNDEPYSFLVSNKPTLNNLFCPICDMNHKVLRLKCNNPQCKSNVISEEVLCLTCLQDNYEQIEEFLEEDSNSLK